MAGNARIGTAYIDVEADFSRLDRQIRAFLSGDVNRVGQGLDSGTRDGMRAAEQNVRSGGQRVEAQARAAGQAAGNALENEIDQGSQDAASGMAKAMQSAGPAMEMAGVAAGAALAGGLVSAISVEGANDKLAAQLGASEAESKRIGKVAGDLYAGAYGDSLEGVNEAVGAVMTSIKGMSGASSAELQTASTRALDFATAFDIDVTRAVQSVGTLMRTGLAADSGEAFDLITKASQKVPAALREDILDASDEYGQFFSALGFSGEQAFSALVEGSKKGTFGIDKMGDAVKEFTLLATEVDNPAVVGAYQSIGLNAEEMSNAILRGGKGAQRATQDIIGGLLKIKDPSKQAAASVALFGTPLEDLNKAEIPEFLRGLQGAGDGMAGFSGSADEMGKTLNDNVGVRFEEFKRGAIKSIEEVSAVVLPVIDAMLMVLKPLTPVIGGITAALVAYTVATKLSALATAALNAAFYLSPFGWVALAIVGIVTAIALLWAKSEAFRNFVTGAWEWIKQTTMALADAIGIDFGKIAAGIQAAWDWIQTATMAVWEALKVYLTAAWQLLKTVVTTYFEAYKAIITTVWDIVSTVTRAVWNVIKAALTAVWSAIKTIATTYWNAIKSAVTDPIGTARDVLAAIWTAIRAAASAAWNGIKSLAASAWDGIKDTIVGAVRSARDLIDDVWASIEIRASNAWANLKSGASSFAEGFKDKIVGAFEGAEDKVTSLVKSIIGVLNRIPGVNIGTNFAAPGSAAARQGTSPIPAFARGGVAHAHHDSVRSGAKVTRPMMLVGEQAPIHPEWIIPSNPAYRDRALALYGQLGRKLGVEKRVAMFARGGVHGDHTDRMGGSPIDALLDLPAAALTGGAKWFIDKLPGTGGLPPWLAATGKWALDKATSWIKQKVKTVLGGALGSGGASFAAVNAIAQKTGNMVTSGYRPGDDGYHGQNRARDYAGGDMLGMARLVSAAMGSKLLELIHTPLGYGIKHGQRVAPYAQADHYDHVHVALAKGGVFGGVPFVGSYQTGGVVPADGLAMVHAGETITPKGEAMPQDLYLSIAGGPFEHVVDARIELRERGLAGAVLAGAR